VKIEVVSKKVICSNENSIHNYFAWPTVARLQDGRLAMVASGFRLTHLYGDTNGEGRLHELNIETYLATRAVKPEWGRRL